MSLKLYLVSCDLLYPGGNYASLREKLRTMGAEQILESQWALKNMKSASELKEELAGFIDRRDRITVTEVGQERASRGALSDLTKL